jgi:hypothetical protein
MSKLKLYHAKMDDSISGIDEFVVAETEEQVKEIVYKPYDKSDGFSKEDIGVYEVLVDGYDIQLSKK